MALRHCDELARRGCEWHRDTVMSWLKRLRMALRHCDEQARRGCEWHCNIVLRQNGTLAYQFVFIGNLA